MGDPDARFPWKIGHFTLSNPVMVIFLSYSPPNIDTVNY
jgi:hypothetical protein